MYGCGRYTGAYCYFLRKLAYGRSVMVVLQQIISPAWDQGSALDIGISVPILD
jgi:hypothetical protein